MRSQAGAGGPPSAREADAECRGSGRPLQTPQKKNKSTGFIQHSFEAVEPSDT